MTSHSAHRADPADSVFPCAFEYLHRCAGSGFNKESCLTKKRGCECSGHRFLSDVCHPLIVLFEICQHCQSVESTVVRFCCQQKTGRVGVRIKAFKFDVVTDGALRDHRILCSPCKSSVSVYDAVRRFLLNMRVGKCSIVESNRCPRGRCTAANSG